MVFVFPSPEKYAHIRLFMGKDKFENEDLIKYHCPQDVWFHVNSLSSAHLYLRRMDLPEEQLLNGFNTYEQKAKFLSEIPDDLLETISQLTKENSIQGKKEKSVRIIYTMASNLKKTGDMQVGQVSYHDNRLVKYHQVKERDTNLVNTYKRKKVWEELDLKKEKDDFMMALEKFKTAEKKRKQIEDDEERKKREEQKKVKNYEGFFQEKKTDLNDDDIWGASDDESDDDVDLDALM
uniref:NFACT RNA-binding domain-containing protein n=1 Tax=Percolomonas cosmopolitus TaxID=63605 RepID=A0A7S1PGF5_9EUKA